MIKRKAVLSDVPILVELRKKQLIDDGEIIATSGLCFKYVTLNNST